MLQRTIHAVDVPPGTHVGAVAQIIANGANIADVGHAIDLAKYAYIVEVDNGASVNDAEVIDLGAVIYVVDVCS